MEGKNESKFIRIRVLKSRSKVDSAPVGVVVKTCVYTTMWSDLADVSKQKNTNISIIEILKN